MLEVLVDRALIEIAAKNGKVTRAEADEALDQKVVLLRPGDAAPEPRKPVAQRRRDYEDDASWRPLE